MACLALRAFKLLGTDLCPKHFHGDIIVTGKAPVPFLSKVNEIASIKGIK